MRQVSIKLWKSYEVWVVEVCLTQNLSRFVWILTTEKGGYCVDKTCMLSIWWWWWWWWCWRYTFDVTHDVIFLLLYALFMNVTRKQLSSRVGIVKVYLIHGIYKEAPNKLLIPRFFMGHVVVVIWTDANINKETMSLLGAKENNTYTSLESDERKTTSIVSALGTQTVYSNLKILSLKILNTFQSFVKKILQLQHVPKLR